jgi:aldehyde dehydrogenase
VHLPVSRSDSGVIFDQFLERAIARVGKIKVGNPLDPATMMGAQASRDQLEKILNYIKIGKHEGAGARLAIGGEQAHLGGDLENGYYVKPTVFVGHNKMGAGFGQAMPPTPTAWAAKSRLAGCGQTAITLYPAHAAVGGYKQSGLGRQTHKMILDHYPQTKNLLVSYSPKASGFF